MFGEKIRQLRENKHLLQRQVSAALDIDNALYCKIERGDRVAKRDHVIKLAKLLDGNQEELLKYWLADKVYDIVQSEENANDILNIVAESIIEYKKENKL